MDKYEILKSLAAGTVLIFILVIVICSVPVININDRTENLSENCEAHTSIAVVKGADPCVAYWLRKIAERQR